MKNIYKVIVVAFLTLGTIAYSAVNPKVEVANKGQSVQVFSAPNADGAITTKTIDAAFEKSGLTMGGDNNMNSPFEKRFNHVHYKIYNLAMFSNADTVLKLIKKYPKFGALTPLTMSIWSDDSKNTMNIATLSLDGMSKAVGIPANDPDLVAYAGMVKTALKAAMPKGEFKKTNFPVVNKSASFAQEFVIDVSATDDKGIQEVKENLEAGFEGEMEPLGFMLPNYSNLKNDLFDAAGYKEYDIYVTYSICKFDVIYPVSKLHPEAGAWAPCSMYIYKKKGENKIHIGYLGVDSWISSLGIKDKESTGPLYEAQGLINKILQGMN
ncbi:MAG: hypothetical protein NTY39_09550 [Campylobacterales bacterium]|nr:hypothetical protein [Campylobacterales bacterium]